MYSKGSSGGKTVVPSNSSNIPAFFHPFNTLYYTPWCKAFSESSRYTAQTITTNTRCFKNTNASNFNNGVSTVE